MRQLIEANRVGPYTPVGIARTEDGNWFLMTKEERLIGLRQTPKGQPFPEFVASLPFRREPLVFLLDTASCFIGFEVQQ